MTSEVVVMNKNAIALAADSAVTTSIGECIDCPYCGKPSIGKKIFKTVDKLHRLSNCHPVAIMIFGKAEIMGVPWEIVIKKYRNKYRDHKELPKLENYADHFFEFMNNERILFPEKIQREEFEIAIKSFITHIHVDIARAAKELAEEKGKISFSEIQRIVQQVIDGHYSRWQKSKSIKYIPLNYRRKVIENYKNTINDAIKDNLGKFPITKTYLNKIRTIFGLIVTKESLLFVDSPGIVITGFGSDDTFPDLQSYHIEMIVNNRLKVVKFKCGGIDINNPAAIVPFAQADVIATFMNGISSDTKEKLYGFLRNTFNSLPEEYANFLSTKTGKQKKELIKKMRKVGNGHLKDLVKSLEEHSESKHWSPIVKTVNVLPKDELASMAETFISLTSFRRMMSAKEEETVGGPIDVAIISKGDGFVWIKRKHYFKAELNPRFLSRYSK